MAATYVHAQALSTERTAAAPSPSTIPYSVSRRLARLLASNSTGRLTTWKNRIPPNASSP